MLGYTDKKGAHITMPIKPEEVEVKLKSLYRQRFETVIWKNDDRSYELGWVTKLPDGKWTWYYDTDIFK